MTDLLLEFTQFIETLTLCTEKHPPDETFDAGWESTSWYAPDRKWWVTPTDDLPFHDFNKEICEPRLLPEDWEGYVGIRVDDDFYSVAKLPYKFKDLSMEQIGKLLWPELTDAEYNEEVTVLKDQIGIKIA